MISINIGKTTTDNREATLANYNPEHTLVLPTRNLVLFPNVALPIQLGRETSIRIAEFAKTANCPIAVICQRDANVEEPTIKDLYEYGTLARVIDVIDLPNGVKAAVVEGMFKVRRVGLSQHETIDGAMAVSVIQQEETPGKVPQKQFRVMLAKINELLVSLSKDPFDQISNIQLPQFDDNPDTPEFLNSIAVHFNFDVEQKQDLLKCKTWADRASIMLQLLLMREEQASMMEQIMEKTRYRMDDNNRRAFIQQQIESLREEIGEDDDDMDEIRVLQQRADATPFPNAVREKFSKEIKRLRHYSPQSPDYAVLLSYLETLLSVPWAPPRAAGVSFQKAEAVLERDHYGMKKIKDRVLEQVALIAHSPETSAPILCFVGPPGVGKTSLGQSIADALGRKFQRVSLGGLHDEAEIRGHRRTYIGALPGRIIEAMRRSGTTNPVLMLDEIDKIGNDYKGDPAAALLEVLDPAQNHRFHDNYLDVDYDLSNVLFIATANSLATISKPLLDRIEIIELSGYSVEEKIEIAVRHLIPRLRKKNNVTTKTFSIDKTVIKKVIEEYTSESGVRQIEKVLESLMRKKLLEQKRTEKSTKLFNPRVKAADIKQLLGVPPYHREKYEGNEHAGVVTGLAWTSVGGEILLVEAALSPGKGNLITTGNLGDVMKESATLALEWVKVNSDKLNIDSEIFKNNDIHLHFPEGAVPKDGPSAGITIATALVSALTNRLLKPRVAMTGEITLRGKVLPVGGIKEKILAASRAGIRHIILSEANRRDVEDIEQEYVDGLEFHYVETVLDVLEQALN